MFEMMVGIGLKLNLWPPPKGVCDLEDKDIDLEFSYKSHFFCFKGYVPIFLYYLDPLMNLIFVWDDERIRSKVLLRVIRGPCT